jgi:DNA-binding HxlR family transcriptional regulator
MKKQKTVLNLLAKKYTCEILKTLENGPKRFKDLKSVCENEKMRTQRLRELEDLKMIKSQPKKIGRRAVCVYDLSNIGKTTLKLAEEVKKLHEET